MEETYYSKNKEKMRAYQKEYHKKYAKENREKLLIKKREYRLKNKEKLQEYQRNYYQKNILKINAQRKQFKLNKLKNETSN